MPEAVSAWGDALDLPERRPHTNRKDAVIEPPSCHSLWPVIRRLSTAVVVAAASFPGTVRAQQRAGAGLQARIQAAGLHAEIGTCTGAPVSDPCHKHMLAWHKRLAAAGDTVSLLWLGRAYDTGDDAPVDSARALSWYRKAAGAGAGLAWGPIGVHEERGAGTPVDAAGAKAAFERGVRARDPLSAERLGELELVAAARQGRAAPPEALGHLAEAVYNYEDARVGVVDNPVGSLPAESTPVDMESNAPAWSHPFGDQPPWIPRRGCFSCRDLAEFRRLFATGLYDVSAFIVRRAKRLGLSGWTDTTSNDYTEVYAAALDMLQQAESERIIGVQPRDAKAFTEYVASRPFTSEAQKALDKTMRMVARSFGLSRSRPATRPLAASPAPAATAEAGPTQSARPAGPGAQVEDPLTREKRLAAAGDTAAMLWLGRAYDTGQGAPIDSATALGWYRKAAAAGAGLAWAPIGIHMERGAGTPVDSGAAYWKAYNRGLAALDPLAEERLGERRFTGVPGVVKPDTMAGLEFMNRALYSYEEARVGPAFNPLRDVAGELDPPEVVSDNPSWWKESSGAQVRWQQARGCFSCRDLAEFHRLFAAAFYHTAAFAWRRWPNMFGASIADMLQQIAGVPVPGIDSSTEAAFIKRVVSSPSARSGRLALAKGMRGMASLDSAGSSPDVEAAKARQAQAARNTAKCGGPCNAWMDTYQEGASPGTSLSFAGTNWVPVVPEGDPTDTLPDIPAGAHVVLAPGVQSGKYFLWIETHGYTQVVPEGGVQPRALPNARSIVVDIVRAGGDDLTTSIGWTLRLGPADPSDLFEALGNSPMQWDLPLALMYLTSGELLGPGANKGGAGTLLNIADFTPPAGGS